jgi:hypothetical protein
LNIINSATCYDSEKKCAYIVGGLDRKTHLPSLNILEFNIVNKTIRIIGKMIDSRFNHMAVLHKKNIYIVGGIGQSYFKDKKKYDP